MIDDKRTIRDRSLSVTTTTEKYYSKHTLEWTQYIHEIYFIHNDKFLLNLMENNSVVCEYNKENSFKLKKFIDSLVSNTIEEEKLKKIDIVFKKIYK